MQMQMRQLKGLKQGRAAARPAVAARPARQTVKVAAKAASSEELGFKTMRDGIKVRAIDIHTLWGWTWGRPGGPRYSSLYDSIITGDTTALLWLGGAAHIVSEISSLSLVLVCGVWTAAAQGHRGP